MQSANSAVRVAIEKPLPQSSSPLHPIGPPCSRSARQGILSCPSLYHGTLARGIAIGSCWGAKIRKDIETDIHISGPSLPPSLQTSISSPSLVVPGSARCTAIRRRRPCRSLPAHHRRRYRRVRQSRRHHRARQSRSRHHRRARQSRRHRSRRRCQSARSSTPRRRRPCQAAPARHRQRRSRHRQHRSSQRGQTSTASQSLH